MNSAQSNSVQLFDHPFGIGHALIGVGVTMLPPEIGILISLGFLYYELGRRKTPDQRFGALGEFATGFAIGEIVKDLK